MMDKKLKDTWGISIKRQYFNIPICVLLVSYFLCCEMVIFSAAFDNQFDFPKCINDLRVITFNFSVLVLPLLILSLFNRRLFGKNVGIIIDRELHYVDGSINLEDIVSLNYHFTHIGRLGYKPAYVEVVCKNDTVEILHAPIFTLTTIKKINPNIKVNYDKTVWITPIVVAIICFVISAL